MTYQEHREYTIKQIKRKTAYIQLNYAARALCIAWAKYGVCLGGSLEKLYLGKDKTINRINFF